MDLAMCLMTLILGAIKVSIDNLTRELSKIRKILEEKEE